MSHPDSTQSLRLHGFWSRVAPLWFLLGDSECISFTLSTHGSSDFDTQPLTIAG